MRERYLENTVDKLAGQVEAALATFRNNWHYGLQILKQFRDLGPRMGSENLQQGFIFPQAGKFNIAAAYRLSLLLSDNQVFWKMQQFLFASVQKANDFFQNDLMQAILSGIRGDLTKEPSEVFSIYKGHVEKFDQEISKYYVLLAELQYIASLLEREKFTFRAIQKFREKKEVVESVSRVSQALQQIQDESMQRRSVPSNHSERSTKLS